MSDDVRVTKVDESARVPPVDAAARRRLAAALDRDGVAAVYLFGSQASGATGPLSDVDVAVWASPTLDSERRFQLRLDLIAAASTTLGTDEVDLVVLDDAPPLLRQRAWSGGLLLLDREPRTRIRCETRALVEYLDTQPLREELARGRRRRLAEGRYGRR